MSDYDAFAQQYSDSMSTDGDYFHRTQIDPFIYASIGDVQNKMIYDLGCGNGYMARNLSKKGAHVFASDLSQELIKIAREKSENLEISYSVHDATDFSLYNDGQFDVVIMNMVMHYLPDLHPLFQGISRVLKKGGLYVFSANHVFRPPYPYSEWVPGKVYNQEKLFIKVTGYLEKRSFAFTSDWDKVTRLTEYNHPLNSVINTLSDCGLYTTKIDEPESVGFAKNFSQDLQNSHHIPTFMIMTSKKIV